MREGRCYARYDPFLEVLPLSALSLALLTCYLLMLVFVLPLLV